MFAIAPLLPGFHELAGVVSLDATPAQLVKPDPRRAILYVANGTPGAVSLWMQRTDADPDCPHVVIPPGTTHRFTWAEDGPLSTLGWDAATATGPADVGVVEVRWLPDQLIQSLPGG